MGATKHVPERTCIACRTKRPKVELVRVVRGATGSVHVDPAGKQPGRGAYFCGAKQCWEQGLRKGRLEHVLKVRLSGEDLSRLGEFMEGLPATAEA
ncbi:MAG: YlxR family protein [Chloroflexi bacterium]|nr:YlxR family protein [Chloroflexota bacterium]